MTTTHEARTVIEQALLDDYNMKIPAGCTWGTKLDNPHRFLLSLNNPEWNIRSEKVIEIKRSGVISVDFFVTLCAEALSHMIRQQAIAIDKAKLEEFLKALNGGQK